MRWLRNNDKYLIPAHCSSSLRSAMHYSQSDWTKRCAAKIKSILGIYSEARRLHDSNSCDWLCRGMDQGSRLRQRREDRRRYEILRCEPETRRFNFVFTSSRLDPQWPPISDVIISQQCIEEWWAGPGLLPLNSSQLLDRSNRAKTRAQTRLCPVCHTILTRSQRIDKTKNADWAAEQFEDTYTREL